MKFESFEFHPAVAAGVRAAGFVSPTPIQAQAVAPVMKGRDVMGLAQTGTGKTAAFALPILHRLAGRPHGRPGALIVAPTRELAEQIEQAVRALGKKTGLVALAIYGGVSIKPQIEKLRRGVDIVVACPGRLLDHIGRGTIDLSGIETLVLDEADQMFDMGFLPDIRRLLKHHPGVLRRARDRFRNYALLQPRFRRRCLLCRKIGKSSRRRAPRQGGGGSGHRYESG